MRAVELVFGVGWGFFWLYWLVAAFSMKRGRVQWSRELRIRLLIAGVAILLIRLGAFRGHGIDTEPLRAGLGLTLFALGLAFAIWARVHIGRNWGTPMTQKDDPQLVTTGPYRLVRHPIYSGILLAGVGTAVGLSWVWLTPVFWPASTSSTARASRSAIWPAGSRPTTRRTGARRRCSCRSSSSAA